MKPWEIYDPFWYHMNVKPLTLKEFYGPGLVKGLEEPKKMSFLEWSRMIRKYESNPMLYKGEEITLSFTCGRKEMATMNEEHLSKMVDLFRAPWDEAVELVGEIRRQKQEIEQKDVLLQQYKRGWDGSNSALAKAYEEIDTLKKKVRELSCELDHTRQPKGLPTTYTVDEALTLVQQLTRGVQALEGKSLWLYEPYHFYVQSRGGAQMTKVTVTK